MPAEQTDALVIRVVPWSETSVIASIFTRDFGKLSVLAKGARRAKSPFEAALDLLSQCRVVFIPKSGDALDILTEAKLTRRFRGGASDLLRLYAGYYVAELLERLTDKGDTQSEVFDLAVATLSDIDSPVSEIRAIVLRYELQMLRLIGQLPSFRVCAQCGREVADDETMVFGAVAGGILCDVCRIGASQLIRLTASVRQTLEQFSQPDWRTIGIEHYTPLHRATVRGIVIRYLTVMLDRKLQMHSYLEELGR